MDNYKAMKFVRGVRQGFEFDIKSVGEFYDTVSTPKLPEGSFFELSNHGEHIATIIAGPRDVNIITFTEQ